MRFKPLFLILALATLPLTTGAEPSVPAEERKRQIADRMSTAISDAERLVSRISGENAGGADQAAKQLSSALETARSRWTSLTAAAPSDGDAVRDQAKEALSSLQSAVFSAAGFFADERDTHNNRVRQAIADIDRMINDLSARAAAASEKGRATLNDAVSKLESHRRSLEAGARKLAEQSGVRWAALRKDLEEDVAKVTEVYTDAIHKATP